MPRRASTEELTFGDRVAGGVFAIIFSGLTVIALPLLLAWKFPIRLGLFAGLPSLIVTPVFWLWGATVIVASSTIGFRVGLLGAMDILNLLWGTDECYDKQRQALAEQVRIFTIYSAIATFVLLCLA